MLACIRRALSFSAYGEAATVKNCEAILNMSAWRMISTWKEERRSRDSEELHSNSEHVGMAHEITLIMVIWKPVQKEVVFLTVKQAVSLHLAEFVGKSASVHTKIVSKLLAVKWNSKLCAAMSKNLLRQIGQKTFTYGSRSDMRHSGGEGQTPHGGDPEQIVDEQPVGLAVFLAGGQKLIQTQKENIAFLCCNHVTVQFFSGDGGIAFRKDLALFYIAQYMAAAPVEIDNDLDASIFNQTEF